jgi:hypothetical protein
MSAPEFHADFDGPICRWVRWISSDGQKVVDLTDMQVTEVVGSIKAGAHPTVTITFEARLVESETP